MSAPTLRLRWLRDTKRFGLYQEEGNQMNKLYLEKGLPKQITYVPAAPANGTSSTEVTHGGS